MAAASRYPPEPTVLPAMRRSRPKSPSSGWQRRLFRAAWPPRRRPPCPHWKLPATNYRARSMRNMHEAANGSSSPEAKRPCEEQGQEIGNHSFEHSLSYKRLVCPKGPHCAPFESSGYRTCLFASPLLALPFATGWRLPRPSRTVPCRQMTMARASATTPCFMPPCVISPITALLLHERRAGMPRMHAQQAMIRLMNGGWASAGPLTGAWPANSTGKPLVAHR